VIEPSLGPSALHESAGWPILRNPLTSAAAPHCQLPGTRAKPDCPSYAAPLTQTDPTVPLTIVADAFGSYRRTPGFDPAMVTWRCLAAVRPRVAAAQNVLVVGAALGRGDTDGAVEPAGVANAGVAGLDPAALEPAEALGVVPSEGATLGDPPHPAAASATRSTRPTRDREPRRPAKRNIGRS
jgi:hypothetical protein